MSPSLSGALLRTQSDQRLCALAAEGQERAFEMLVERYRRPLERYLRRFVPRSRLEDVVQQTFLNAWTALSKGTQVREWKPWIYRLAHNSGVDALRAERVDQEALPEETGESQAAPMAYTASDSGLSERMAVTEVLATLASLPAGQREALVRTAMHGESYEEVAVGLGVSSGAVAQLIHRARLTVRAAVTAFIPSPIVAWAARRPARGDVLHRLAEGATASGGTGAAMAATVLKGTSAVLVGGVLAAGPILAQVGGRTTAARGTGPGPAGLARATPAAMRPNARPNLIGVGGLQSGASAAVGPTARLSVRGGAGRQLNRAYSLAGLAGAPRPARGAIPQGGPRRPAGAGESATTALRPQSEAAHSTSGDSGRPGAHGGTSGGSGETGSSDQSSDGGRRISGGGDSSSGTSSPSSDAGLLPVGSDHGSASSGRHDGTPDSGLTGHSSGGHGSRDASPEPSDHE